MSFFHSLISGGQRYSEEYQAVLNQATTNGATVPTSSTQKSRENTFITDLKNAGLWDRALYGIMAKTIGGDKGYVALNWKNPTQSATVTNAILVEDGGLMAEDGIDSGFDLANADQDDVTYCGGALFDTAIGNRALFGAGDGADVSSNALFFNPRNTSDQGSYSVSDATITAIASSPLGLVRSIIARSAGTKKYSFNGDAFVTASVVHSAITAPKNVYLLAMNGSSVVYKNGYGGIRYWWAFSGAFSDADALSFDTAIKKYLTPTSNIPLLFDHFNRASLGTTVWTRDGAGATISISTNQLRLVGAGVSTDILRYNQWGTSFEEFTITAKVTPRSVAGATNYGLAFGVRSVNTSTRRDNCMQLVMFDNANIGKWHFNTGTGGSLTSKGNGGGYALVQNTEYSVRVSCSKRNWTAQLLDSNDTVLSEYSHATASTEDEVATLGGTYLHGQFAIWSIGGTWDVDDFKVTVPKEYHQAQYVFVGDSITRGSSSSSPDTRFVSLVEDSVGQVVCYATGSNKTAEIVAGLNQIIELRPENVVLMIGGNDIFYSVASATYETNYTIIRDRLVAAGINVIHLLATPRTATDIRALNTFIQTDFAGDTIIDTFTPLKGTGDFDLAAAYDSGDGVHPNDDGHALIASTVLAAL